MEQLDDAIPEFIPESAESGSSHGIHRLGNGIFFSQFLLGRFKRFRHFHLQIILFEFLPVVLEIVVAF